MPQTKAKNSYKLIFNPKIPIINPKETLLNPEQLNRNEKYQNNNEGESFYKKTKEIFPSQLGVEIPYKSITKDNLHSRSSLIENSNKNKFKMKKYENKAYFTYRNNMKNSNPFKGPNEYEKNQKDRKNQIAEAVEKEENDFNEIAIIEDNIMNHRELSEEEYNQLINKFNQILYSKIEVVLGNKEELKNYESKITKITNIIQEMKIDEQNKVLEYLETNADNNMKKELFRKLENNFKKYQDKKKEREINKMKIKNENINKNIGNTKSKKINKKNK